MAEDIVIHDLPPTRGTRLACQVHRTHVPRSHINERHHIWPKAQGGPDTADNLVVVCATGHNSIHDAMSLLHKHEGTVPWVLWRIYSVQERRLALLGYRRSVQQHL